MFYTAIPIITCMGRKTQVHQGSKNCKPIQAGENCIHKICQIKGLN